MALTWDDGLMDVVDWTYRVSLPLGVCEQFATDCALIHRTVDSSGCACSGLGYGGSYIHRIGEWKGIEQIHLHRRAEQVR